MSDVFYQEQIALANCQEVIKSPEYAEKKWQQTKWKAMHTHTFTYTHTHTHKEDDNDILSASTVRTTNVTTLHKCSHMHSTT